MNTNTIRVDIDTQHGFCDPEGGLYVRGAEKAIANVAALNRDAAERSIPLIGSVDTHDFASPEFQANGGPWPAHCVKGTWDWLKPEATLPPRFRFVGRDATDATRAAEGGRVALYFEKDAYSFFDNRNLDPFLDALGGKRRFEVYGIATDYCVRAAALELRKRGHEVVLVTDAIAGVAPETTEKALAEMRAAGIGTATTKELLQ
jgi:nicotinamidase/pyrazinamidase